MKIIPGTKRFMAHFLEKKKFETSVANFTHILRAAFKLISFHKKFTNPNKL